MLKLWLSLSFLNCVALTLSSAQRNSTVAAAWYTSWHARDFPVEQLSWSKYTHLTYAFAYVLLLRIIRVLQSTFTGPRLRISQPWVSVMLTEHYFLDL
jgi:hypothetical protein